MENLFQAKLTGTHHMSGKPVEVVFIVVVKQHPLTTDKHETPGETAIDTLNKIYDLDGILNQKWETTPITETAMQIESSINHIALHRC